MKRKMHLTKTLSMAKWILCMLVVGGLTFTTYSCKDYDDDIDNLQGQINTIKTAIETLEGKINTGKSITSVTPTTNGIKITLSDNSSYDITNGTNGTNGADGTNGSVWTIGTDGFWYKDNVKTDYKAVGEKGDKGDQGDAGSGGGDVYVPNADGFWYKNGVKTDTKWRVDGTITAVEEDGVIKLYGVPGYADGYALSMNTGDLKALVLETDAVVEGYPAIEFMRLTYRPLTAAGVFANASATVMNKITNTPIATYHMNPSSVTAAMIQADNLAFNWKGAKILSRSASTEPTAEFVEIKDGRLVVKVLAKSENIYTSPIDSLDLVALQVPLAGEGAPVITSDYAALHASIYDKFEIAHAGKTKNSYTTNRPLDGLYFYNTKLGVSAFNDNTTNSATNDYAKADIDTTMVWNGSGIDLAGVVALAEFDATAGRLVATEDAYDRLASSKEINPADFGFEYSFEVVNTSLGQGVVGQAGVTNQADFVKLTGTKLTVDVYGTGATTAAIDRTPIIKVTLKDKNNNNAIVKVAFIKVKITGSAAPQPTDITFDFGEVAVDCSGTVNYSVRVDSMNLLVYSRLGLSKDQFHSQYTFVPNNVLPNIGIVVAADPSSSSSQTTEVLKWTLTATDLWANVDDEITYIAQYTGPSTVSIKLKAKVVTPNVLIELRNVYTPFWDDTTTPKNFMQNVKVPAVGENVSTLCSFSNILYSGFITYQNNPAVAGQVNGQINFSGATDYTKFKNVYDNMVVSYTFADANKNITSYGSKTGLRVTLNATKDILYVNNIPTLQIVTDPTASALPGVNTIQVIETAGVVDPLVKELISTGELYAIINTSGLGCGTIGNDIEIGGAYSTFNVKFVTPVKGKSLGAADFEDAVSGGSNVDLFKLLSLSDWRNQSFVKMDATNTINENAYLFGYYGVVQSNIVINGNVMIKAKDGTGNEVQVNPNNITLVNGIFTYKNEGSPITKDHMLTIPLKVPHKWGDLLITINATVKPAGN